MRSLTGSAASCARSRTSTPGETVLVVSHGGAIGLGVPNLCRMDVGQSQLDYGGIVAVLADADGWVCTSWG